MRRPLLVLLAAMLGLACGPPRFGADSDGTESDSESGSSSDSTGSSTSTETETDSETSETDSGTTETETTETDSETSGGPICGDGIVDPGEACDLGPNNAWELTDCQPDCTLNECGDGWLGPNECPPSSCPSDCPQPLVPCDNWIAECGDLIDNDSDGLIDLYDPDCLSPCDDSEDALSPQLPFDGGDCKRDCFFDDNSGSGDDQCEWNFTCDPQNPGELVGCPYDPDFGMCPIVQDVECMDKCMPIVANGCDCFGCCEIAGQFRHLDDLGDCSADNLEACPSCTPHPSCFNPCEADDCELCLLAELAPGCDQPSCPEGIESCTDPYGCGEGEFCQTGCCRPTIPPWG
jgi:hypothetical protein